MNLCEVSDVHRGEKSPCRCRFATATGKVYSCGERYAGIEHNNDLKENERKKEKSHCAVKIAIGEELSKAVIVAIKFFEMSGGWDEDQRACFAQKGMCRGKTTEAVGLRDLDHV